MPHIVLFLIKKKWLSIICSYLINTKARISFLLRKLYNILMRLSVIPLLVSNMVPLVGVLFFDWSLFSVLFLYWAENGVIGIFNVLRMSMAQGPPLGVDQSKQSSIQIKNRKILIEKASRFLLIPFFMMHYGTFFFVHGVFLFVLFGGGMDSFSFVWEALFGVLFLCVSHGMSFLTNYVGKKEYLRVHASTLFIRPYARVIPMHLALLGGGFAIAFVGGATWALVLLIATKVCIDVLSHLHEHSSLDFANKIS